MIYDSWDQSCRKQIGDLQSLPLHDENGHENRIYDVNGRKIARRNALISDLTLPYGLLVNLRTVTSLFESDDMDVDDDLYNDDEEIFQRYKHKENKVSLSVYPQAFLHDYGHIQAKGSLQLILPTIQRINSDLIDNHDDSFDEPRNTSMVTAISTQMYNEFMHRAATQAGALDVVRGRISGALSAPPVSRATPRNQRMADTLQRYCELGLPHKRFAQRMQIPDCPTALRVESVYIIDMNCIPEDKRTGRFVHIIFIGYHHSNVYETGHYTKK